MNRARSFTLLGLAIVVAGCGGSTKNYTTPSSAMEPTIHCARPSAGCEAATPDTVVVENFSGHPERGDILVFETPSSAERKCGIAIPTLIKRVVALPGETWETRDGYVYIDGERLAEAYVTPDRRDQSTLPPRRVPEEMLVVMGDNRSQSCDSRVFGAVPRANMTGKVIEIERGGYGLDVRLATCGPPSAGSSTLVRPPTTPPERFAASTAVVAPPRALRRNPHHSTDSA